MSQRTSAGLALLLFVLTMSLFLANLALLVGPRAASAGDAWLALLTLAAFVFILVTASVGMLIASRRPGNPIGWTLSGVGLCWTIATFGGEYAMLASQAPPPRQALGEAVAWVSAILLQVSPALLVTVVPLLYPDGRVLSQSWRTVLWLGLAGTVLFGIGIAFAPGELFAGAFSLPLNPMGVDGQFFAFIRACGLTVVMLCGFLGAISLVLRFRRGHEIERLQIKWLAFATGVLCVLLVFVSGLYLSTGFDTGARWYLLLATSLVLGWACLPAAIGVALLRYRLYEIDRIINRTLVYGGLTLVLGLTYWVAVVLLQQLMRPFTQGAELAVVGSTLAVAALFQPLRQRIQRDVDRRFYRRRYDASRTVAAFAGGLRHQVDLDTMRAELLNVVRGTMQPSHASLWLRVPRLGNRVR